MSGGLGGLERLPALADPLVGAWGARARASTTTGRERAILRAFGVSGLDPQGRPLAWSVVDRWLAGRPERLAAGITLPFTVALLEYDMGPQDLALDIATGAIDLALEAQLLEVPERRVAAEAEARRLGRAAIERMDANRTARLELLDVLGDADRPWLGAALSETSTRRAATEAADLVRAGADLVRVSVPTGRELAMRLLDLGLDDQADDAGSEGTGADDETGTAPVGSQRGLSMLRGVLDEAAAERGAYVRIATAAPALSAPEQAVVAAFERVDVVEADPFREIVEAGIDPDRALADHAFAHGLHGRGGTLIEIGAGTLVVAPDLLRGVPSDPATRAGRTLALQLLAVRLAVANGLEPGSVLVGALPDWLLDEPDAPTRGIAEVAVRRVLFPGHPIAFDAPAAREDVSADPFEAWSYLVAAALGSSAPAGLIVRPGTRAAFARIGASHRAARAVGAAVAAGLEVGGLQGDAAEHAARTIAAAAATLEGLRDVGWRAVLGDSPTEAARPRLGADAVVERTEAFDPFAVA